MGKLFCLLGKSATGKDTIYEQLISDEQLALKPLVSYTTRPIREGEVDGETYHFTDEKGMQLLSEQGKVIELRCYQTVLGPWYYFTADDGRMNLKTGNYLYIGTLVSYEKIRAYYGAENVVPLYIEVADKTRLLRSIERESHQKMPHYEEVCRRFLADQEDFSPERLEAVSIRQRFCNDNSMEDCLKQVKAWIQQKS